MSVKRIVIACGLSLGIAGAALADGGKQSIHVSLLSDTSLNGTPIPAGRYEISWTESNSEADVTLKSGGKVVAQGHAKVVEEKDASSSDTIVSRQDSKGTIGLAEIRLKGKKGLVLSAS
jgi:hypothetical protein